MHSLRKSLRGRHHELLLVINPAFLLAAFALDY